MKQDLATKEEKLKENQISIYPNPSRGSCTIASMQDNPIESLHVYNLIGTLMFQKNSISTARFKFESKLAQGTYFSIISEEAEINKLLIFNINGQLLNIKENLNLKNYKYTDFLEQGSYILIIHKADGNIHHRKIIRL